MASFPVAVATLLIFPAFLATHAAGIRVSLTRIHSDPNITASEFVRAAVHRDMHRSARFGRELAVLDNTAKAPLRKDLPTGGEYLMTLAIGTPPLAYPAIADTGSDLIWTQCAPCSKQCFKQPTRMYNPKGSPTFAVLQCNSSLSICAGEPNSPPSCACSYNQTYGTGWTSGVQSTETFTFGSGPADQVRVPGVAFGCSTASSDDWNGSAGLVGLGRGSLSLVSQLGAGKFSYCLTPFLDTNSTSTLLLGPSATTPGRVRSTPFVASPSEKPMSTYYYLNLTGISMGKTALSIPPGAFSLHANGSGGLIIDSGTTITWLVDVAYQQVRSAVQSLVALPVTDGSAAGLDLCFAVPLGASPPAMPDMTFHLNGADMVVPVENYMLLDSGLWCLAMGKRSDGAFSTLGNYQQQNMHILYDLKNEVLSFAPAKCSSL